MNRTNSKFSVKNLVLGALFLALALVLPFFTGQIPQIGAMLCPMHLPILLAGFVCGGPVGAVVGFIAPLLRMVMFGMPPFYTAIAMAFELLTYGLVSGIMYRNVFKKQTVGTLYGSLLTAMVAGRIIWGIVKVILSGAGAFTFAAFISGALLNAIPGIVVQLILVPAVVVALQKAKLIEALSAEKA
ncbi:MAG: ECF transporter S component [Clostridiales bacterium 52_15]|nr:MAG: ECF transporter S component [Clostridiales bacterium 52_15]